MCDRSCLSIGTQVKAVALFKILFAFLAVVTHGIHIGEIDVTGTGTIETAYYDVSSVSRCLSAWIREHEDLAAERLNPSALF